MGAQADFSDDPCPYCQGTGFTFSATLIRCEGCGVVWGRCNGVWRLDDTTVNEHLRELVQLRERVKDLEAEHESRDWDDMEHDYLDWTDD